MISLSNLWHRDYCVIDISECQTKCTVHQNLWWTFASIKYHLDCGVCWLLWEHSRIGYRLNWLENLCLSLLLWLIIMLLDQSAISVHLEDKWVGNPPWVSWKRIVINMFDGWNLRFYTLCGLGFFIGCAYLIWLSSLLTVFII